MASGIAQYNISHPHQRGAICRCVTDLECYLNSGWVSKTVCSLVASHGHTQSMIGQLARSVYWLGTRGMRRPETHLALKQSVEMGSVRKNNKISDDTRKRIIQTFERGEDWHQAALLNGVKIATAYSWLHADEIRYSQLPRGGNRRRLLNEEEIDELLEWVAEDPTITLDNLRLRVKAYFEKAVSTTTISRCLDGRCITMKKLRYLPAGMNTDDNKNNRRLFVLRLLECFKQEKKICWIDETNFNLFCTRTMGRSLKGTNACITVTNCRGRNIHLIGAMTEEGIVHHKLHRGSFNKEECNQWLRTLLNKLKSTTQMTNLIIVCDNAPCHVALENVFTEEEYLGGQLLRLAPYSPMLNPIESVWSIVKSKVKQLLRARFQSMTSGDPSGVLSLQDWRMLTLERIITEGLSDVSNLHCSQFAKHALDCCMTALNGDDM